MSKYGYEIFRRLKILEPKKSYILNKSPYNIQLYDKLFHSNRIVGGGNEKNDKTINITYKNDKYYFVILDEMSDPDYIYYAMHERKEKAGQCIVIVLEKEEKNCAISSVSYYKKCFTHINGSGSDLMKISLLFIEKLKKKHDIKTITLLDNSQKICKNGDNIQLWLMMTLLTGDTWYGRYGFLPAKKDKYELHEPKLNKYKSNKKIINNIRMKDIPDLKNMLIDALKNDKRKDNIMNVYDECYNDNYKLMVFMSILLDSYDKNCDVFEKIYKKLAYKIGIEELSNTRYIKFL